MKKVNDSLTCRICYDFYKDPKYLPCYHSYCKECLAKLMVQSMITCPECRKPHFVPSGEVKQLPSNFFINRLLDEIAVNKCVLCICGDAVEVQCLDCEAFLCSRCFDNHKYSKEHQNHDDTLACHKLQSKQEDVTNKPQSKFASCQEHHQELKFYCEKCDQLVCQNCIIKEHCNHSCDTVNKIATNCRKQLSEFMESAEKLFEELSVSHSKLSNAIDEIEAQSYDIDKEIDGYYIELQQRLCQQRDVLKKKLHEASRKMVNAVTLQLEQMEHNQVKLKSIKELNSKIKIRSDQEILSMKRQVINDMKRIRSNCINLCRQPVQSASLTFVTAEEYKTSLPQFGQLLHEACALNSKVDHPQCATKGDRILVKVVSRDQFNNHCQKGGSEVAIQVVSVQGDVTSVEVDDNENGTYSASFVANKVGEMKLSATINGQQVNGGPFSVIVHGKCSMIDKPSAVIVSAKMGAPWGIAFSRDGMWAVTDESYHCVWIFDRENQLIRNFGSYGHGCGKFARPVGIVFDSRAHLYVTDIDNHRVQKFDISGAYILQFGTKGSANGQLMHPLGIAFRDDKVYVTEWSNHRVSVFQLDGQFCHIIGSGHLKNPRYISVSSNNHLLVANKGHHCISIFTLDGIVVGKLGTQGTGLGQLNNPSGIVTDTNGFIFVTERGNNRVSIFDKDGIFIHSFGSRGSNHGQFSFPYGIAIHPNDNIYITDALNKRIQIFSP